MSLLVNYDSSDNEDNCDETVCSAHLESRVEVEATNRDNVTFVNDKNGNFGSCSTVESLPTPTEINVQDMIVLPSKKEVTLREKPPVLAKNNKIIFSLPSIENSDSEEDDRVPPSKKMCLEPKSSLLGNLPKPKFVPTKDANKPLIPYSLMKKSSTGASEQVFCEDDESDEEDDWNDLGKGMNFLMPTTVDTHGVHESAMFRYQEGADDSIPNISSFEETPRTSIPQDFARDEHFQKIMMSQDIVEVKLDEHLRQYEAERLKDITRGPALGQNQKPAGQVNQQSRRKHQITYLALQAKEREFELKNQWAENKFNKRQTQSKYGF